MPKQSRGFWVCVYCEQAFDQYADAEYHESHVCTAVARGRSGMVSTIAEPVQQWQHSSTHHPPHYTPSSRGDPRYTKPEASIHYRGMAPLETERGSPPPMYEKPRRYFPLMGSQDPSSLSAADTLACRSTELFEMMPSDLMYGESSIDRPSEGQVGLRCTFCADDENASESYIFPSNMRSIGDSLRVAGFEHLSKCRRFPDDYRRQIKDAMWQRKSLPEGQTTHEDQRNRRALGDYCVSRCEFFGIADRHPTGLTFTDMPMFPVPQQPTSGYSVQRRDDQGMPPHGERMYGGPPPSQYAASRPQYREPAASKSDSTSAMKRDDDTAIEPTPLSLPPSYPPQHQFSPAPMEFPFFYEHNQWVCKFCAHVPPPYRDPQYFWPHPLHSPPPHGFIDYHLSVCREFQKGLMYEQQAPSYGRSGGAMPVASPPFGPLPGWDQRSVVPTPPRSRAVPSDYHGSPEAMSSPYATPSFAQHYDAPPSHHQSPPTIARTPITRPPPSALTASSDIEAAKAIEHLEAHDLSRFDGDGNIVPESERLVLEEDRLLLTDYFFYLMKQLRPVRFSESDRRTRGGKRELVKVGYGGLQCVHCVDVPNTRKFFWSNVDRLANSFAEIPNHVLKCRRCPQPTKDALLLIKQRHSEQMSRLPRGSQKVFFRRMWRRLHEGDPVEEEDTTARETFSPLPIVERDESQAALGTEGRPPGIDTNPAAASGQSASDNSPAGTSGSDESVYFLQRPAQEAAKALIDSSMQPGPPTPSSRVLLAIPEDREWLSDTDCFVRRQLEVFCASAQDVECAVADRKYPIKEEQVGIRCIHCALNQNGTGARGNGVAFPFSISGIYESAREFQRIHLEACENLPLSAKAKLESLKGSSSLSSVLRKYFVLAAKALGLQDTPDGIRAGAKPIPIGSQAAFTFAESIGPDESVALSRPTEVRRSPITSTHRKRKADSQAAEQDSKRAAVEAQSLSSFARGMSMLAAASDQELSESGEKRDPSPESDPTESGSN